MGILGGTYNTIISDLTKIKTFQQKRDHSTKVIRIFFFEITFEWNLR